MPTDSSSNAHDLLGNDVRGEYVEPCLLPIAWDPNVPDTFVMQSDGIALLVFRLNPEVHDEPYGGIVWRDCLAATLGPPNDEAVARHPLADKGLVGILFAGKVRNSHWVRDLRPTWSTRPGPHHWVALFKESMFQCLASEYEVAFYESAQAARRAIFSLGTSG